jgi:hypothetical protein
MRPKFAAPNETNHRFSNRIVLRDVANPATILPDGHGLLLRELRSSVARSLCLPVSIDLIALIVTRRSPAKMCGIAASLVVARMERPSPFGRHATGYYKSNTVCTEVSVNDGKLAVPFIVDGSFPRPAFIRPSSAYFRFKAHLSFIRNFVYIAVSHICSPVTGLVRAGRCFRSVTGPFCSTLAEGVEQHA